MFLFLVVTCIYRLISYVIDLKDNKPEFYFLTISKNVNTHYYRY